MHNFFYPSSIAIIGVSDFPANLGRNIIQNLESHGFDGEIYPVGGKGGAIGERVIYPSVVDVPEQVDLAMILIRAAEVPKVAEECGKKGITRLVISSAGFSELGPDGLEAEARLGMICEQYGICVVGPNCMGLMNTQNGLCLPFTIQDLSFWKKGPLGIISQSGTVATEYARHATCEKLGVSKVASIGNKFNLDEVDFLEYYLEDPETEIIFLHIESFSRGKKLLELAASSNKPILIHKSNTSPLSHGIAQSHTSALADNDEVADYALKQAGMIRVESLEEFFDCVKVLLLPPLKGNRLAILSIGGGIAVMDADECFKNGFDLPPLSPELIDWLKSRGKAGVISPTNPIDLGDIYDFDNYPPMFEKLLEAPYIDGIFYDTGATPSPPWDEKLKGFLPHLNRINQHSSKPIFVRIPVLNHPVGYDLVEKLDMPFFRSQHGAFKAMRKVKEMQQMKYETSSETQARP